ncbi:MAG: (2Fe-2S)-binding protein, partial [Undibacterium sp.]|nr:(2Fe-2S)-binding protein [Undibacterium sp.]
MSQAHIQIQLNGQTVACQPNESLLNIAKRLGIAIPHLCYKEGMATAGNCRACVVEVKGERTLAPSCCRNASNGMEVTTNSERAIRSQKLVLELLQTDFTTELREEKNELSIWSKKLGIAKSRFTTPQAIKKDQSHPAISVNLDACILCTRCVRACRETQVNDVIGLAFRGSEAKIVFDMDAVMGNSTCVACGECVQACPTGALLPAAAVAQRIPDQSIDSVCPYCGVGCQLTYQVKDNTIIAVDGRDGPANHQRL